MSIGPEKGPEALDLSLNWLQKLAGRIRGSRSAAKSALIEPAAENTLAEPRRVGKPLGPYRTPASANVRRLIEDLRLEEGYAEALETLKFFQLLRSGEKAPDFSRVLKTFTPAMRDAAQKFQEPRRLVLITKGRSFDDLVYAMNAHKTMPRQDDIFVAAIYRKRASQKPKRWGAYIVEAPVDVDVQNFDDTALTLRGRLKRFSKYKKDNKSAKIGGMDRLKHASTMMQAFKEGKVIDDDTYTILDEDSALSEFRIPGAEWCSGYDWFPLKHSNKYVRFRRSVGGDVPEA